MFFPFKRIKVKTNLGISGWICTTNWNNFSVKFNYKNTHFQSCFHLKKSFQIVNLQDWVTWIARSPWLWWRAWRTCWGVRWRSSWPSRRTRRMRGATSSSAESSGRSWRFKTPSGNEWNFGQWKVSHNCLS